MELQFKNFRQKLQQGKQFIQEVNQEIKGNTKNLNLQLENQNNNIKKRYFLSPPNRQIPINQLNNVQNNDLKFKQINIQQYQRLPFEQLQKHSIDLDQIKNQQLENKLKINARQYSENDEGISEIRSQSRQESYKTPWVVNSKKLPKAFQNFVIPCQNNIEGNSKLVRQRNKSIADKVPNHQIQPENSQKIQTILKQDNNYFKIQKKRNVQSPKCLNVKNNINSEKFSINMDYFQKKLEKTENEQNNEKIYMKALKRKQLKPLQLSPKYKQSDNLAVLNNPKLNEMITLIKIRDNYRKVVHAPTLLVYTITEFQITTTIGRQIKNLLLEWKNTFDDLTCFAKIKEIYWNSPEGQNSILMEYQNDLPLSNIINKFGSLPENIIQGFSQNILTILATLLNCQLNIPIRIISPEQFFIDKDKNLFFNLTNSQSSNYMDLKYKISLLFSSLGMQKYQIDHENSDEMLDYTTLNLQFEIGLLFFYFALEDFAKPNKKYQSMQFMLLISFNRSYSENQFIG